MGKIRDYIFLHLSVVLFSFTSVFSKSASNQFNEGGLGNPMLYVFVFLMFLDCLVYALCWQKVIKRFDLNIGYANRSVYLLWSLGRAFLRRNSDTPEYHWTSGGAGRGCDRISKRGEKEGRGIEHGTISTDYVCGDFFYSHLSGAAEAERRKKILPVDS